MPAPKHKFDLSWISNSRLARRVLFYFVLTSILPLILLTYTTQGNVESQLTQAAERRTRERSKAAGMALFERLLLAEHDLRRLTSNSSQDDVFALVGRHGFASSQMKHRFSALLVTDSLGKPIVANPQNFEAPQLSEFSKRFLEENGRLIVRAEQSDSENSVVMILKGKRPDGQEAVAYGVLNNAFIFQIGALEAGEHLFVSDGQSGELFSSDFAEFSRTEFDNARMESNSTGKLHWSDGDQRFLGGYWLLFSQVRYGLNFMIVSSLSEEFIMEPINDTISTVVRVVLLTAAIVALLSLAQIRRLLGPIEKLRRGAERIADGELVAKVEINSGDELQVLGETFNKMSRAIRSDQKAKEEFFGMMSHELRTPLNAILGYSYLLQTSDLNDEQAESAVEIVNAGEELNDMIQAILDYAALDQQEGEEEDRAFNIEEQLESVARQVAKKMDFSGSVDVAVGESCLSTLKGKPELLSEALRPLIDNAIKYCGDEPIVIEADAGMACGEHIDVVISVTDAGPGLAEEDVDRLKNPLERGREGTKSETRGAGLGIAMCQKLVQRLGGTLDIESEVGRGSKFSIRALFDVAD